MRSIRFVNFVRYLTLSLSLIGFGCHLAQCTLFSVYRSRTKIPGWLTAGHWQYLVWYISLGFSIICALAVCTYATCCGRAHILRGDRCLGTVNIMVLVTAILVNTFLSGQEPWTNGIVEFKEPAKGFVTYCSLLDEDHDATYPLLLQRCLLVDSTYISTLAVCLSWIILTLCACFIKPNRKSLGTKLPYESNSWDNHYYISKPSSSYDMSSTRVKKYTTPISSHAVMQETPGSYYDTHHIINHPYPQLTVPGGWQENTSVNPRYHYYS